MESFLRNEIGGKNMKKLFAMLMVGAMALTATGCGSNSGSKGGASGQTLTVGAEELAGLFSPIYYETAYDGYAVDLVYQSLLDYDVDSNLVPELAAEMPTVSKDGKTVTFKLKKGIKFSDGSELNANDVKFTFTVTADYSYTGRFGSTVANVVGFDDYNNKKKNVDEVSGIKVIDDYTVEFNLKEARIDSVADLGTSFGIISDEQFKDYKRGDTKAIENAVSDPIGSGPYKLNKWDKASGASFVKNDQFQAEEGKYQVANIIIKPVEMSTEIDELTSGNVDLLAGMIEPKKIGPASTNENLTFNTYPRAGEGYIAYNCATGATADQAVRQALTYAFDRQAFVDSYYKFEEGSDEVKKYNVGYVPTAFLNPASELGNVIRGEEELEGLETYEYNIEKAKQILDEAGWTVGADGIREKGGQKLTIKLMAIKDHDILNNLIPMWNKSWKKDLGVDFQQTTVDFNTLASKVTKEDALGEWNVFFMAAGFTGTNLTEINAQFMPENKGAQGNYARIADEELGNLLKKGMASVNNDKQAVEYYKKAIITANELCAYVPVYGNQYFDIYNKKIKGLKTGPVYTWADAMADVTIE